MKKIRTWLIFLPLFFSSCSSHNSFQFLVGTYTDDSSQGINHIKYNSITNEINTESVISDINNPSFVITNKKKSFVVSVEETASNEGGKITSYSYNIRTNKFEKLSSFFTKGDHPCTIALSPEEDFVVVGNYSGGNLSVFPIDKSGKLSSHINFIQHFGKSKNIDRQEKPHVHSIVFHPKENKIFIIDLGTDTIEIVPFQETSKSFLQTDKSVLVNVPKGSGPRHLIFSKDGSKAFSTFELTNEIGFFEYKNNQLTLVQKVKIVLDETQNGSAAEVRLSKDEKYIYASVRGNDNFIAVLKFDETKKLQIIQKVPTSKTPRNFILTNNDETVLVANQNSNSIMIFKRNKKTGLLTATSSEFSVNKPVYFCAF